MVYVGIALRFYRGMLVRDVGMRCWHQMYTRHVSMRYLLEGKLSDAEGVVWKTREEDL